MTDPAMENTENIENTDPKLHATHQKEVTCPSCGGNLVYKPGSETLKCEHCGSEVDIDAIDAEVEELDLKAQLADMAGDATEVVFSARCQACGAQITLDANVVSERCPFCSSVMVVDNREGENKIKPRSVLPFGIDADAALKSFHAWVRGLWFAPNGLSQKISRPDALKGVYLPYWTFDASTHTTYIGRRGDTYTDREGKTKVKWRTVSGAVSLSFDDMLVVASKSVPKELADPLEPWDLDKLRPYDAKFLAGYRTETYQVGLEQGFDEAQKRMRAAIDAAIKRDIGGDLQRIVSRDVDMSDLTYKHILLPVYASAFRYRGKVFRFLVNARTGEVQGKRPYSWIKITLAVIIAAGLLYLGYRLYSGDLAQAGQHVGTVGQLLTGQ